MTNRHDLSRPWLVRREAWWSAIVVSGVLLSLWPLSGQAQISPFRGYKGPTLSKEDLASGQAAVDKLLTEDQAEVGKSEDWAGQTSGNKGTVSVQKTFQRQGIECRTLRSVVHYKMTATSPRTLTLNVCRLKTGDWKLM